MTATLVSSTRNARTGAPSDEEVIEGDLVFPNRIGGPMDHNNLYYRDYKPLICACAGGKILYGKYKSARLQVMIWKPLRSE